MDKNPLEIIKENDEELFKSIMSSMQFSYSEGNIPLDLQLTHQRVLQRV